MAVTRNLEQYDILMKCSTMHENHNRYRRKSQQMFRKSKICTYDILVSNTVEANKTEFLFQGEIELKRF